METNSKSKISQSPEKKERIETCFTCNKKFNINCDDLSHYHYGKYPMCDYCSHFYGFYKQEKI